MKWHWITLLAGFGFYVLVLIPGILPHAIDTVVILLAGVTIATVALFGFHSAKVDRMLASLMVTVGLILLIAGIVMARQGHGYILLLFAVPALGLGLFGARKLMDKREKHD